MPSIYYNNLGSQQSTILESDITKENLENVIGEVYCYGVDNYDNEPPKYIVVVSQDGEPIYNGKLNIPENGNIRLEPNLTDEQQELITTGNTVVKTAPSEFGDETDIEDMDGGKRRSRKSRKNKSKSRTKKNVARGFGSDSSSSSRKKTSSLSRKRTILKNNGTRKLEKRVRINSPRNETRVYSLESDEKTWKRGSPSKRGEKCGQGKYPCVYRGVIFENREEWNEYAENTISRNASTGYIPVSSYRKSIISSLSKKGKSAKRIPEEFRLYNIETGEIFDLRELDQESLTNKRRK